MTKVVFNRTIPMIDRDSFLTPFDKLFDQMVSQHYPEITKSVGVNPMQGSAYPKVNVYEYDDKIGIVAEIPGLNKKQLDVSVEDGILTISGDKHNAILFNRLPYRYAKRSHRVSWIYNNLNC